MHNAFFSAEVLDNQQRTPKVVIHFALPDGAPGTQVIQSQKEREAQKVGCGPLAWNVGIPAPRLPGCRTVGRFLTKGPHPHLRKETKPEGLSWRCCSFRVGSPPPSAGDCGL